MLNNMERPTSALHLPQVTLNLQQFRADPHTKEVGPTFRHSRHFAALAPSIARHLRRSATEPIDDTSTRSTGKLMERMLAAFARFDQ
jgi:hypothetical protein